MREASASGPPCPSCVESKGRQHGGHRDPDTGSQVRRVTPEGWGQAQAGGPSPEPAQRDWARQGKATAPGRMGSCRGAERVVVSKQGSCLTLRFQERRVLDGRVTPPGQGMASGVWGGCLSVSFGWGGLQGAPGAGGLPLKPTQEQPLWASVSLPSGLTPVRAWWARHRLYQPHTGLSYWWSRRAFRTRAPKSIRPGLIETPPLWACFLICGSSKGNAGLEVSVQVTWAASTRDLARGQPWVGGATTVLAKF